MTTKEIKARDQMVVAAVVDDRTEEEKRAAAPLSLAAGSYSIEDLEKIAQASVKGAKNEDRDAIVEEALFQANQSFTDRPTPGLEAGMKLVERTDEATGITEVIQVRAKPAGETEEETAEVDAKVAEKQAGTSSSTSNTAAAAGKE